MPTEFRPVYECGGGLPVRLEVADVERPPGSRYLHHRLVVADGRPGVVILARRGDEVLLVRSVREAVGGELWELPRGSSEVADAEGVGIAGAESVAGEDPADSGSDAEATLVRAGCRELREETGWSASEARLIGRYRTDSTIFPQRMGVVLCRVDPPAQQGGTDGEVEEARWIGRVELDRMVRDGEIVDAHTLSALALAAARGEAAQPGAGL